MPGTAEHQGVPRSSANSSSLEQHPQARKRGGHTGTGQALVIEGARVKLLYRK